MTLSRRRLAFIGVAAVAALVLGFLASRVLGPGRSHSAGVAAPASAPPAATATPAAPAGPPAAAAASPPGGSPASPSAAPHGVLPTSLAMVGVSDARTGFRLSYPRTWTRLSSNDPAVPLLLSSRDGASLRIRAVQFAKPIDGRRLAAVRDLTGLLIRRQPGAQIIAGPRLLATASLPGFLYLYSFADPLSHRRVAHSQIALFAGRRMFTLVFQTARAADLPRFAMLFDKITASFHAI